MVVVCGEGWAVGDPEGGDTGRAGGGDSCSGGAKGYNSMVD